LLIPRGQECRGVSWRPGRELQVGAESAHGQDVVIADNYALVGKLGLEMEDAAVVVLVGAQDRPPVGAVGMHAPDAPAAAVAHPLRFECAEDEAAVLEDRRVQGAADVEMADLLDIRPVLGHDEERQRRATPAAWRREAVPGTG